MGVAPNHILNDPRRLFQVMVKLLGAVLVVGGISGLAGEAVRLVEALRYFSAREALNVLGTSTAIYSIISGFWCLFMNETITSIAFRSGDVFCGHCGWSMKKSNTGPCDGCGRKISGRGLTDGP